MIKNNICTWYFAYLFNFFNKVVRGLFRCINMWSCERYGKTWDEAVVSRHAPTDRKSVLFFPIVKIFSVWFKSVILSLLLTYVLFAKSTETLDDCIIVEPDPSQQVSVDEAKKVLMPTRSVHSSSPAHTCLYAINNLLETCRYTWHRKCIPVMSKFPVLWCSVVLFLDMYVHTSNCNTDYCSKN